MKENPHLVVEEELMQWANCTQRGRLIKWLDSNHIDYYVGIGGRICTTLDALNGRPSANDDKPVRFL